MGCNGYLGYLRCPRRRSLAEARQRWHASGSGCEPQAIENFVDGFLNDEGTATFGRPAGIAVAPDGALLFTDDTNGIVYRVQHY